MIWKDYNEGANSLFRGDYMKKTVYIEVQTTDPRFNLALEEYVFEKMSRDREYFLTWRNDNAIIVGRHQNTAAEINEEFVKEKNKNGMSKQVGKSDVFTKESLIKLQDNMRTLCIEEFNEEY